MQPSSPYDSFPPAGANNQLIYPAQWIDSNTTQSNQSNLQYILDRSARKLRYRNSRPGDYVQKVNRVIDQLNQTDPDVLAQIPSHKFHVSLRNIIQDLFYDWHGSYQFTEDEFFLLRNVVRLFDRLVNIVPDINTLTTWLLDSSLIDTVVQCLQNIDSLLAQTRDRQNLKPLIRLIDTFTIYRQRLPLKAQQEDELQRLFEATVDCLVSSSYERAFKKLKPDTESMTTEQKFFLVKCPSLLTSHNDQLSQKTIDQILGTMVPRYASILDKHIRSVSHWKSSMIHAVHHLLLTVIHVRGHYTVYANGQPLQWLIDHIIHIISEPAFIQQVNKKTTNAETLLMQSALRTLTAFVREPDLLMYIKQQKITSVFRSLLLLANESVVLHAYVMLSYTLEEDDIKASAKDSGRLLSKIFDSLRKKIKSLSTSNKSEETIERNISLLIEAVQALVQHDQIKSEILKQNALPLLVNHCQQFNDRSKRLVLESIGSMTFDEEAARVLRENEQFIKSIEDMQKSKVDGVRKAAEKILWNLIKEPEREKTEKKKKKAETKDQKDDKPQKEEYLYDIMISYCHADKELVYRVHQFLAAKGFKIWFDRDNIYGPAMQAMADAVENSEFVILCMSDSYKRSVYCQAEAEYAFRCKRRLIPIIVRQGYRADGWLGLVIGSRIYVDFGRMEFTKACELVLKEITLQRENRLNSTEKTSERLATVDGSSQEVPKAPTTTSGQSSLPQSYTRRNTLKSTYRTTATSQWTRKDVLDFLYDKNLHHMMPICELLTGSGLEKLFHMCQMKPSRFYTQLNEELIARFNGLHLPIGIFTEFLSEMDRLTSSPAVHAIEQDAHQSDAPSLSQSSVSSTATTSPINELPATFSPRSFLKPVTKTTDQHSPALSLVQTTSPVRATIQTSRNVQITEQIAYRTESLGDPSTSVVVRSTQDTISTCSKQTELTRTDV